MHLYFFRLIELMTLFFIPGLSKGMPEQPSKPQPKMSPTLTSANMRESNLILYKKHVPESMPELGVGWHRYYIAEGVNCQEENVSGAYARG
jgi:hypothetical protein